MFSQSIRRKIVGIALGLSRPHDRHVHPLNAHGEFGSVICWDELSNKYVPSLWGPGRGAARAIA